MRVVEFPVNVAECFSNHRVPEMKEFQHCFVAANHPFVSLLLVGDDILCVKLRKNIDQTLER